MSETKFTPGPWVNPDDDVIDITTEHRIKTRKVCICRVDSDFFHDDFHLEQKANANLIASAPELYRVLELAKYHIEGVQVEKPEDLSITDEIDMILAKARGES